MDALKFLGIFPRSFKHLSLRTAFLILTNIAVGITVFYLMGAQHTSIGFHADDYGFIYNGNYRSMQDIKRIFKNGDMISNANGLWDTPPYLQKVNFLEALYRPLLLLLMGTQFKISGLSPYRFHLVHTGLHTLITLLLLNLLAAFSSLWVAFPLALFFGFHTSLKDYFFWQCYVQNTAEAFLAAFLIFTFFMWYYHRSRAALIISFFLLFLILLLRETLFIFPVLVGVWYLYDYSSTSSTFARWVKAFKYGLLFSLPVGAYIGIRLWAHPFSSHAKNLGIKHFPTTSLGTWQHCKLLAGDRLTWLIDLIGLKWLPSGTALLKGGTILALLLLSFYCWQKTKYKKIILISSTALLFTSWPSLLLVHCSRYLYLPTFFFSLALGLLLTALPLRGKYIMGGLLFLYAGLQANITLPSLTDWCIRTGEETRILKEIAASSKTLSEDEHLFVLGFPSRLFNTGSSAAIKLYGGSHLANIYFLLPYYTRWEDGPVKVPAVFQTASHITLTSSNTATTWFEINQSTITPQGTIEILHKEDGKVSAIGFTPAASPTVLFFPHLVFSRKAYKGDAL